MSVYVFPLSSGTANSKVNFEYMRKYVTGKYHKGLDLDNTDAWENEYGAANILASIGGTVYKKAYDTSGWGHYIVIKGNDGYYHIYGHMKYASSLNENRSEERRVGKEC